MYLMLIVACNTPNPPKDTAPTLDSGALDADRDADGDDIAQEDDCNDNNPSPSTTVETYTGDVDATNLPGLENLHDVPGITAVDNDLTLYGNVALQNLGGLEGVTHIGGDLLTADAEALRDAIDSIGGIVTISGNAP